MSGAPKVLIVFPYEDEYGPFRALRFAVKGLRAAGCEIVCVLPPNARALPGPKQLGVEVRFVEQLGTVPRTLNPRRLAHFLRRHLDAAAEIERVASEHGAELVYSLSEAVFCGGIAARRLGLPSITHVMGLSIGSPNWAAGVYIPALRRITTRFIAISAAVAEMLEAHGVPESQMSVVHNGVAVSEIDATLAAPAPIAHAGPKLGMVAAYDPRKGHQLFVEAAALLAPRHPDARFYIVGGVLEGQRESVAFHEQIHRLIGSRRLGGAMVAVGQVQADEVYRWIQALDVLVVPSRTEAFGYVQYEAMASRRPVIATRIEGNLDAFVDGESGIYVGESAAEVAAAAERLLDDRELARRLGRAGRQRVERFFDERHMIPLLAGVVTRTLRDGA